jgi:hypothetical protein
MIVEDEREAYQGRHDYNYEQGSSPVPLNMVKGQFMVLIGFLRHVWLFGAKKCIIDSRMT